MTSLSLPQQAATYCCFSRHRSNAGLSFKPNSKFRQLFEQNQLVSADFPGDAAIFLLALEDAAALAALSPEVTCVTIKGQKAYVGSPKGVGQQG